MQFDLRTPLGYLFTIYGLMLTIYGLVGDKAQYSRSMGINVNLWWGLAMLIFGVVMFIMSRRGSKKS